MQVSVSDIATGIRDGHRRALARAITLIESTRIEDRQRAGELLEVLSEVNTSSPTRRIGITGTPGVGKSTFIEVFGLHAISQGHRVAVLSIDPSSALSGGSILGDKTRMPELSRHADAYIRPSPAQLSLGGIAQRTHEVVALCEAANFDTIIVETVGVGQSETSVAEVSDLFLLLMHPGGGDELQGIKRGIMELADLVLVNKADGDLSAAAGRTAAEYKAALGLIRSRQPEWSVPVMGCSALENLGIDEAWVAVRQYESMMKAHGYWEMKRREQLKLRLHALIHARLYEQLLQQRDVAKALVNLEQDVMAGRLPPSVAAARILSSSTSTLDNKHEDGSR